MTPEQIKKARELCDKASPGPWVNASPNHPEINFRLQIGNTIWPMNDNDADFIAASRELLPKCLDEIERLQSLVIIMNRGLETLDSEVKAARERLGPAGYKMLQDLPKLRAVAEAAKGLMEKAFISDLIPNNDNTRLWLHPLSGTLKALEDGE